MYQRGVARPDVFNMRAMAPAVGSSMVLV